MMEESIQESIEESRRSVTQRTNWMIDESTFQVIDPVQGMWIARVTATHSGHSFTVLVEGFNYFVLEDRALPALRQWFQANKQE